MLRQLEERLGLPPLQQGIGIIAGPTGKRLMALLGQLERLSKDKESLTNVMALLEAVERLDKAGTLTRLTELLKELKPLTKGKAVEMLVEKLDTIEKLLSVLMSDEK